MITHTSSITHLHASSGRPTAPRDFVLCTTWQEQQNGSVLIASMSADDSLCAPQKGV
jgi:hypothetical protein